MHHCVGHSTFSKKDLQFFFFFYHKMSPFEQDLTGLFHQRMSGVFSFPQPEQHNSNTSQASIDCTALPGVNRRSHMLHVVDSPGCGKRLIVASDFSVLSCGTASETSQKEKCCVCLQLVFVWVGITEIFKSRPPFTDLCGLIDFQSHRYM